MMAPNIDSMVSLVYRYDFNMQIFQSFSFKTLVNKKKIIVCLFRRIQLYNPAQKICHAMIKILGLNCARLIELPDTT